MHKILFIHPDKKIIDLYRPHIERHLSFDSAIDGLSGLRKLKLFIPSLVISDYALPKMSGLAILKYMRQDPKFQIVPFLFFSDHPSAIEGLSFGANGLILPKFASPDEVLADIFRHLRSQNKLLMKVF